MSRWLIWLALILIWTVALEFPVPDKDDFPAAEFVFTYKFILGKSLHLGVYAWLTASSVRLPLAARYRWLMMFFLMFHAWGTEMLQKELEPWCHRGGKLSDVGIDIAGIALGAALTWKSWTDVD